MSGFSRGPLPAGQVVDDGSSKGGSQTNPAANKTVVDAGAIGAGSWLVECYTQYTGTVTAGDTAFAMMLTRGTVDTGQTEIAQLFTTAVSGGGVIPIRYLVYLPNATDHLQISVDDGITSGGACVYSAMLVWYPITLG